MRQAATRRRFSRLALAVCGVLAWHVSAAAQSVRPAGYVNDYASVLDADAERYLEEFLETLERDTSAEVVVVAVSSLDGMSVEEYASRLFADWGIGKEQHDNGVLLLVAPRERRVRIEVGYGLEPVLPDGLAGEIIRTAVLPEFSAGNIPRGIGRGLDRIAHAVRRAPLSAAASPGPRDDAAVPALFVIPFAGLFVALGGFATGLGIRTKTYCPLLAGALFTGIPWIIAMGTHPGRSLLVLLPLEIAAVMAGYRRGGSPYWLAMLRRGRPDGPHEAETSTWVMGGAESSSSDSHDTGSSSSTEFGGFGGGSSGGGGASGRW